MLRIKASAVRSGRGDLLVEDIYRILILERFGHRRDAQARRYMWGSSNGGEKGTSGMRTTPLVQVSAQCGGRDFSR
jgi:hypothetical protein